MSISPPQGNLGRDDLHWTFSTLGCPQANLQEIFLLAERHGLGLVELRCLDGALDLPGYVAAHGWLQNPHLLPASSTRVGALNSSLKLTSPFEEAEAEFHAFAPLMTLFGARSLRVFDGPLDTSLEFDRVWRWLDAWEALRQREGWGFDLTIETHDSLLDAGSIQRLFSHGHPHIGLLWDTHHTWRKANGNPLEDWPQLRPWTTHLHVKDSISRPSARHPFTYVLPGEGEMPLEPLLQMLREDGFAEPVSLEWEKHWHPYLPDLNIALTALDKLVGKALRCPPTPTVAMG